MTGSSAPPTATTPTGSVARPRRRMPFWDNARYVCIALVVAPLLYPWLENIWLGILIFGFVQFLLIPVLFHVRMAIARVGKVKERESSADDGA